MKVNMTFLLNKEKFKENGTDPEIVLSVIREFASTNSINEISFCSFERNDEHGAAVLTKFLWDTVKTNYEFFDYFDSIILTVNDEREECMNLVKEYHDGLLRNNGKYVAA